MPCPKYPWGFGKQLGTPPPHTLPVSQRGSEPSPPQKARGRAAGAQPHPPPAIYPWPAWYEKGDLFIASC